MLTKSVTAVVSDCINFSKLPVSCYVRLASISKGRIKLSAFEGELARSCTFTFIGHIYRAIRTSGNMQSEMTR